MKSHVRAELIAQERQRIVEQLGNNPSARIRAIAAVARNVILNGPYWYNGEYFDVLAKSLGAGVYELTRKKVE